MHKEPASFHKFEVLVNHFVELVAPIMVIIPIRSFRIMGGLIQIIFQVKKINIKNIKYLVSINETLRSQDCFDRKWKLELLELAYDFAKPRLL